MVYNPKIHNRRSMRLKGYDYSQSGAYFITICCQDRRHLFGKVVNGKMQLNDAGKMVEKWYYELQNKFPDIKCHEMIVMPNHFHCIIENTGSAVNPAVNSSVGADLRVRPIIINNNDLKIINDENNQNVADNKNIGNIQNAGNNEINEYNKNTVDGRNTVNNHTSADICDNVNDQNTADAVNNVNNQTDNNFHNDDDSQMDGTPFYGIEGEHGGSPLGMVVQWFKTMSTNEYIRGVKTLGWKPFPGKLWQRNYHEIIIRSAWAFENISNYIKKNPDNWKGDRFTQ